MNENELRELIKDALNALEIYWHLVPAKEKKDFSDPEIILKLRRELNRKEPCNEVKKVERHRFISALETFEESIRCRMFSEIELNALKNGIIDAIRPIVIGLINVSVLFDKHLQELEGVI